MPVKTEKELNETQRSLWLKALAAMELRNFGYAISLLQGILKQEPEFLTGRQLLRRAEVAKQKARKKSFFNISTAAIAVMKAQREIKRRPQGAVEMIEKILEDEPYNRQANLTLKEAAVAAGWPEIGVFALRTLLEQNPRDVKLLHELGQLHHQMGQREEEVQVYNRITEIDPLDAAALRLGKDAAEREIAVHEEFLAGHLKKDPIHAKKTEELQAAKKKRAGMMIEETKKCLERNPTDLQLRFELGEHLMNAQRFREAIPELQRARQNPNARLKAMNLLGICYREAGMLDLAMKQFEDAAKEILTMDPMKKEIVYNLGIVYEKMGEREKSLNCMKQIYEADYGYKDVAERVESSYPQDKGGS